MVFVFGSAQRDVNIIRRAAARRMIIMGSKTGISQRRYIRDDRPEYLNKFHNERFIQIEKHNCESLGTAGIIDAISRGGVI